MMFERSSETTTRYSTSLSIHATSQQHHETQSHIHDNFQATKSWPCPVSPLDVSSARKTVYLAMLDIAQQPATTGVGISEKKNPRSAGLKQKHQGRGVCPVMSSQACVFETLKSCNILLQRMHNAQPKINDKFGGW